MEIYFEKICEKIKNLRSDKRLTQQGLAQVVGVSRQSIISIEQGKCLPSLPLALAIARAFDMSLDHFLEIENRREVKKHMPHDLTPWSPMREISNLHESIDRLFEENWPAPSAREFLMPTVNVYEKGNDVIVKADVPGVKEEDLNIEVGEDYLILKGERHSEEETEESNYFRKETTYGAFSRAIALPAQVDKNKAEAELHDGILTIILPKVTEVKQKVTKIKVKKA